MVLNFFIGDSEHWKMSQEIPRHYTDTPPYITFCPKEESFLRGKLKSLSGQMPSDDYLQNLAFNLRKPAELLKQWFTEESESFKHHLRGNAPSQVSKQCMLTLRCWIFILCTG